MGLADILTGYSWVRCPPLVQLHCYDEVEVSSVSLGAVNELGEDHLEEAVDCQLHARVCSIRSIDLGHHYLWTFIICMCIRPKTKNDFKKKCPRVIFSAFFLFLVKHWFKVLDEKVLWQNKRIQKNILLKHFIWSMQLYNFKSYQFLPTHNNLSHWKDIRVVWNQSVIIERPLEKNRN